MEKLTCSQRCLRYLRRRSNTWVASGEIQRIASQKSTYTGSTVSRALRLLAEQGAINVKQIKGHSHYMYDGEQERKRLQGLAYFENG